MVELPAGIPRDAAPRDVADALRMIQARGVWRRPLCEFVELAWREVESRPFISNWHIRALTEHLAKVNRGEIRALIACYPPRHSKSLITTVFWPAWTWLRVRAGMPLSGPRVSFAFASWSAGLATDHNLTLRRLVDSAWYRAAAGAGFAVDPKVSRADDFRLRTGGRAFATSVNSTVVGYGFDVRVADDASPIQSIDSGADRAAVARWYDEVWKSRVEDPKRSAEVIIMQRAHQQDLVGHVLASPRAKDFTMLCLPAEYDPDHKYRWAGDPRTERGELLDKVRFGKTGYGVIAPATAYARAAQMQQDPVARGAGIFAKARWQFADDYPREVRLIRYWDKAATAEGMGADPDYTAGVLGGFDKAGLFWLVDVARGRWSSQQVQQRVGLTAREIDGREVSIWIEEEPGSSGKDVTALYQRLLSGYAVRGDRVTGQKLVRIDPFLAAAEAGNVVLVRKRYAGSGQGIGVEAAGWHAAFLDECDEFTGDNSGHDDQVVAAAGCFSRGAAQRGQLQVGRLLGI
jgi:predicted phage terminase large subunit-like protein